MTTLARLVFACFTLLLGVAPAGAANTIGVVLLHGKTGMPSQLAKLSAALTVAGYAVETPEMCWSKKRIFDKAFPACLAEVDAAVADLKARGATKIVVGGTSQGAVGALAYAADHPTLAGVVGMAPACDPGDTARFPEVVDGLRSAHALVAQGRGDTVTAIEDIAGGKEITVKATPTVYLSFHGTDSPIATMKGMMVTTLPKLAMPLLWVAGARDGSQVIAPEAFAAAPRNGRSRYVTVDADHGGTPDAAVPAVVAWLQTLQ